MAVSSGSAGVYRERRCLSVAAVTFGSAGGSDFVRAHLELA